MMIMMELQFWVSLYWVALMLPFAFALDILVWALAFLGVRDNFVRETLTVKMLCLLLLILSAAAYTDLKMGAAAAAAAAAAVDFAVSNRTALIPSHPFISFDVSLAATLPSASIALLQALAIGLAAFIIFYFRFWQLCYD